MREDISDFLVADNIDGYIKIFKYESRKIRKNIKHLR
jgi:hypothetical protein